MTNGDNGNSGIVALVAIVILVALAVLFFVFVFPQFQNGDKEEVQPGIDINIKAPPAEQE